MDSSESIFINQALDLLHYISLHYTTSNRAAMLYPTLLNSGDCILKKRGISSGVRKVADSIVIKLVSSSTLASTAGSKLG